jgi:acetyl/propionyl-CoA carboxylase alpha subunit
MNTRLQVEHPVTELVTGRDLVGDQLRIAGGETLASLGLRSSPPIVGHAIEARLYAEDPEAGFLPATGRLSHVGWPEGVRIDAGIRQGDEIGDRYDPMLAKVIAHGRTRAEALERLRAALAATAVLGVRTNLRFLRWLLDQEPMRDGEMRTDTIPKLTLPAPPTIQPAHWQAAASLLAPASVDPWSSGWRVAAEPTLRLRHGEEERGVTVTTPGEPVLAVRDGTAVHVDVDGQSLEFELAPAPTVEDAVRHASAVAGDGAAILTAPMPGRVIAVRAEEGAPVAAHQPVVIIEAMKMEHAVVAPLGGRLVRLHVSEGQQVRRGDVLAEVAAYHEADG